MDKERQYDAFISYKHQELDSLVAMRLHRMLEHYRIPGKIQATSGKKRIHGSGEESQGAYFKEKCACKALQP